MALYDDIQKNLEARRATAKPGAGKAAADIIRAKTGKAGTGTGPRASAVGEGAAIAADRAEAGRQAGQGATLAQSIKDRLQALKSQKQVGEGALQTQRQVTEGALDTRAQTAAAQASGARERFEAQQQGREAQQVLEITNRYQQALAELATTKGITEDRLFADLREGSKTLAQDKKGADKAQRLHTLAMANKEYVQELNQVAAINRLEDSLEFGKEVDRLAMGEQMKLYMEQLDWMADYNAGGRSWNEKMNSMDISNAEDIANIAFQGAVLDGMISGASDIGMATYSSSSSKGGGETASMDDFESNYYKQEYPTRKDQNPYGSGANTPSGTLGST